ncbi:MAG: hypothetical protein WKG06_29150 [Segetibacter sp.]
MLPRRIDMAEPWSITSAEVSLQSQNKEQKPEQKFSRNPGAA